ncbi:unnamed protein product [Notodromas monacha]|uniref:Sedoheptulokinase n=1 Tax=Notodromas monacha TaxID=399045 RepID=A0A7R9BFI4_9CRUS|nr:unnamed protein product [Notodromas monacha]CAG0914471.1 unnamed protein product [Notodromas monacha]
MKPARNVIQNHHLGLDLGTTSVKAVIWDSENQHCECEAVEATGAKVPHKDPLFDEQSVTLILNAVQRCIARLPAVQLRNVESVGVSGQMHGVVFWSSKNGTCCYDQGKYSVVESKVSNLVTWQDGRCTEEFLRTLPVSKSHVGVSSGFGCATIFWLQQNSPQSLSGYDCAGTIQDFLVAVICGLEKPVMTTQNAASWGYFDTASSCWEVDALKDAGFPLLFLPEVEEPRFKAGRLKETWCGVPAGTSVGAAFGDMQCAVHSVLSYSRDRNEKNAVLNFSTSAQLSFVMKPDFKPIVEGNGSQPIQYWPYFGKTYLAVAASLNGGNVLAKWIAMFSEVFKLVGVPVADDTLWQVLTRAAAGDDALNTNSTASPLLFGERHLPASRGSISNLGPDGFSASGVTRALCRGLVSNLLAMMPVKFLRASGVQGILGTGSALIKNQALRDEVGLQFELPFVLRQSGDAAVGAAKAISEHP